jgi:two-component system sensor histidine kinase BaeS
MFALVVGALVFAGLATLGLTALDSVGKTESQLVVEAKQLATGVQDEVVAGNHHDTASVLHGILEILKAPLNLQGEAVYGVRTNFTFYNLLDPKQPVALPGGLHQSELQSASLVEGLPVTGHRGNLAWAALLFSTQRPVAGAPHCPSCQDVNLVVVLTRRAPVGLGSAGTWFAIAAAATVVVSLLAATRLGRRIARPLQQVEAVTGRIAAGDLSARVTVPAREGHELVSLADSVNQMAKSLAAARGAQRQFLMSVSHDLRTPLTSIRGYAEALADGAAEDVPHAASVVLSEARRLERLVGDLLELAKLEAGSFGLSCTAVDLFEVVLATAEGFEPAAAALGLTIELQSPQAIAASRAMAPSGALTSATFPTSAMGGASGRRPRFGHQSSRLPERVLCYADPDRLAQVVANVIENALKYASQRVTVTASYGAGGEPQLVVEDDGPGIPPTDLDRVFERLYQSASAASRKLGSGLGLAIVHELVTAMGGKVRAESPAGPAGGTRMVVTLRRPGASEPASGVGRVAGPGASPA